MIQQRLILAISALFLISPISHSQNLLTPIDTFSQSEIRDIDFSPDGRFAALASEGICRVYELQTGTIYSTLPGASRVAFAPNGKQLALVDQFYHINIHDLETGESAIRFRENRARNFAFSRDGSLFAVAFGDHISWVNIYHLETGTVAQTIHSQAAGPLLVAFSDDNSLLAATQSFTHGFRFGPSNKGVFVYSVETGDLVQTFDDYIYGIYGLQFLPGGARLMAADGERAFHIWDAISSQLEQKFTMPVGVYIWDFTLLPNGRHLLFGRTDSRASLYDLEAQKFLTSLISQHHVDVRVAVSPDGQRALTLGQDANSAHLWDIGAIIYPNGETPTVAPLPPSPTATMTPTQTPTPDPEPLPLLLNENMKLDWLSMAENATRLAVHPSTGELLAGARFRNEGYRVHGPIDSTKSSLGDYPLIAQQGEFPQSINQRTFSIASDGMMYFMSDQNPFQLFRFNEENPALENFGSLASLPVSAQDFGSLQFNDMKPIDPAWSKYGLREHGLLALGWLHKPGLVDETLLIEIQPNGEEVVSNVRLRFQKEMFPIAVSNGPEGRIYILGVLAENTSSGNHQGFVIYRYETNGALVEVFQQPFENGTWHSVGDMAYWPKDESFYVSLIQGPLYRIHTKNGSLATILEHQERQHSLAAGDDSLYLTSEVISQTYGLWEIIAKVSYVNEPVIDESPYSTPFPTSLPEGFATPTPTPTVTTTPTPKPFEGIEHVDHLALVRPLYRDTKVLRLISAHPTNGDVALLSDGISDDSFNNALNVVYLSPDINQPIDLNESRPEPSLQTEYQYKLSPRDVNIAEDGTVYTIYSRYQITAGTIVQTKPDGTSQYFTPSGSFDSPQAVHVVKEGDQVPGANPGDVLILQWQHDSLYGRVNRILKLDPANDEEPITTLIESSELPKIPFQDITTGPDGRLFFLASVPRPQIDPYGRNGSGKIFYQDGDGTIKEWSHWIMVETPRRFVYRKADRAFYVSAQSNQENTGKLIRVVKDGFARKVIEKINWWGNELAASSNGDDLFLMAFNQSNSLSSARWWIYGFRSLLQDSSQPEPTEPTATPTAIPGWLMLDGYGGIHSSETDFEKPVLPYFAPFNIVRDIEPDPLGRGWYMLDGYGGIHTSSPNLPIPQGLPYFGFDIARNLEVKQLFGKNEFYVLDGFGGIHTTQQSFFYGALPFVGVDWMCELERDGPAENNRWLVMDRFGTIYTQEYQLDVIRFADAGLQTPSMRAMVRFPDGTTVMVDKYGGRHTNEFHPALDVMDAMPKDIYFPWLEDIIWDIEMIPGK